MQQLLVNEVKIIIKMGFQKYYLFYILNESANLYIALIHSVYKSA